MCLELVSIPINNGVLVSLQCSQSAVNFGSGMFKLISKYAEHTIKGLLSMSIRMVVMSGEQKCPSFMLRLKSPMGRIIAERGLPPVAER